ncbi:hypothetical protein ACTWPT_35285 [Nonomuraea sp. 3N208]|uniref:hypothetical protein n=1 Tax=Nonomuraea sp. 3N208 TaxID=3457421 RepID=UPI003FD68741
MSVPPPPPQGPDGPWRPPYGPPPQNPDHPWQPPYGPPPPPPSSGASTGLVIGLAFAGLALYSAFNIIVGFVIFAAAMDSSGPHTRYVAAGAAVLALVGLGAGIGLLIIRRPWARGLGLGLMIGWALWSILSAGICTGLNPSLYA